MSALFSTAYLPPIHYFSQLIQYPTICIEKYENYSKQSYRNRCNILSANGLLPISIPIKKTEQQKTLISDIRISYQTAWQKIHFKSIESAYRNSPFYEFYIDDLLPFFEKKYDFLLDYNTELLQVLLDNLQIKTKIEFSTDYEKTPSTLDFRESIHPKKRLDLIYKPYHQVFSETQAFVPNLTILDLIFNLGNRTKEYLQKNAI